MRKTRGRFHELKVVDFFCGAGGMSYGLQQAGLRIIGGIDNDEDCKKTYEKNLTESIFLHEDISRLPEESLTERLGICRNDDNLIFAGCSPCQFWSKVITDRTKGKKTAYLLNHFQRFIGYFLPAFVLIENVPGLLTRKDHTILPGFFKFLREHGYTWADAVVDASQYGVPQRRQRYLMIATRIKHIRPALPKPIRCKKLTVRQHIGIHTGLKPLNAGESDPKDALHRAALLSTDNLRRLQITPLDGGDRRSWRDTELQIDAYRDKNKSFRNVYGRIYWDRPAPTITTRFNSLSNGRFGHPEQDRALTLREGALLQTFPKKFSFIGSNQASIARQIGNAVPPALARQIGLHLLGISSHG